VYRILKVRCAAVVLEIQSHVNQMEFNQMEFNQVYRNLNVKCAAGLLGVSLEKV
jgi:hypothetical protein